MPPTVQVAGDLLGLGLQLPAELFEADSKISSNEGPSMSAIAGFTVIVTAFAVSNAYYRFYLTPLFKRAEVACYSAVETAGRAFTLACVDDPCTVQEGIQTLELRFIKLYQEQLSLQDGANSNRYFKYSFWTKYLDLSQKVRRYVCEAETFVLHREEAPDPALAELINESGYEKSLALFQTPTASNNYNTRTIALRKMQFDKIDPNMKPPY